MDTSNKIYFLSTGRAGTSFLYKYFNILYPELKLTHQRRWSRIISIIGNIPLKFKYRRKLCSIAFNFLKKGRTPKSSLDPLISLSIYSILNNNKSNNLKIVHLVRDPRDFVTSFMNWKTQSLSKIILHYLTPFWQPFPANKGIPFYRWVFLSKFEKFCWVWFYKNFLFKQLENTLEYKLVIIEDLTKSDSKLENLKDLNTFLQLENKEFDFNKFSSNRVNKSNTNKFPKYNNWSQKQKNTLIKICGDLMLEFGYKF